jgi:hypothetical protein
MSRNGPSCFSAFNRLLILLVLTGGALSSLTAEGSDRGFASSLPALQTNVGGDAGLDWRYANAVLGTRATLLDSSPQARSSDRFAATPSLLDVPLTESGWPRSLPDDVTLTITPEYRRKKPSSPGEIRSEGYESLTGVYVITWKGRTLPDGRGNTRFRVLDTVNDRHPSLGTLFLPAGENRIIALVRNGDRGVNVRYEKPDPTDPIRDVRIWVPKYPGAGLDLDLRVYDPARLGPGKLSAWNTEPALGAVPPLWHPLYLKHLREDPSGVLRFMEWLAINNVEAGTRPVEWSDRKPPAYTLGGLVGASPANWIPRPVPAFKGGTQVPYEWIFDLCNTVEKDAWIQVPHVASENHIARLAALAATSTSAGRRIWFELSNELWNNGGAYLDQYRAAEAEGKKFGKDQGWGSGHLQAKALKIFEGSWLRAGRTNEELINVVSGFARSPDYNAHVLEGAKAVLPELAEALAITTYFGSGVARELYALPYGAGNPPAPVYDQAKVILGRAIGIEYPFWKANAELCRTNGIPMIAYEGGSHVTAAGYGDWNNPSHAAFMRFLANLHKHPVMADLYLEQWAYWNAAGGRTASVFVDIRSYGFYGYWGSKEDVTEGAAQSPRWQAALEYSRLQAGVRSLEEPIGARPTLSGLDTVKMEQGAPATVSIAAGGSDAPVSLTLLAGSVPAGLSLSQPSPGSMVLRGKPTVSGSFNLIFRAMDRDGDTAFGVSELIIDPMGSSRNRLVLFDPASLPAAPLARSEGREEYRTRFDILDKRGPNAEATALGPRLLVPFDGSGSLFSRHYIDPGILIDPHSAFAIAGGVSLSLDEASFRRMNPPNAASAPVKPLSLKDTTTVLWIGLRNRRLEGRVGSSVSIKTQTSTARDQVLGVPTILDALLLWRREQFELAGDGLAAFGPGEEQSVLLLESSGIESDLVEWRFVIRQRDAKLNTVYYLSEASWSETAAGRFTLSDFNANPTPGKRWARFAPLPASFAIPPDKELSFKAVDFSRVDGIGIALRSFRSGWHYNLGITRFLVIGKR